MVFFFRFLDGFLKETEMGDTAESNETVLEHLAMKKKNLYFPKKEFENLRLLKWIVDLSIFQS